MSEFKVTLIVIAVLCVGVENKHKKVPQTFDSYVNTSKELEKSDRQLLTQLMGDYQIKQVNITSKYRLQMMRHKEHSFKRIPANDKWNECMKIFNTEIKKYEEVFYKNEADCLAIANAAGAKQQQANTQLEKEIKKWRRSYKFLCNLCAKNNIGDENGAKECLLDYVKRDNYDAVFRRLLLMKLEAMGDILSELDHAGRRLEDCLRICLSSYINAVRMIKDNLNRCYGR